MKRPRWMSATDSAISAATSGDATHSRGAVPVAFRPARPFLLRAFAICRSIAAIRGIVEFRLAPTDARSPPGGAARGPNAAAGPPKARGLAVLCGTRKRAAASGEAGETTRLWRVKTTPPRQELAVPRRAGAR